MVEALDLAAEYDAGFTATDFARVLRRIEHIGDHRFVDFGARADEVAAMRSFFVEWVAEIEGSGSA